MWEAALLVMLLVLCFGGYCCFERWLQYKETKLRHEAHLVEIRCCYDSEQSFLDDVDDPEHLASITPAPSMTKKEQVEIMEELADEDG